MYLKMEPCKLAFQNVVHNFQQCATNTRKISSKCSTTETSVSLENFCLATGQIYLNQILEIYDL